MITATTMLTSMVPAGTATVLAIGPLAALALAGVVAVGIVLIAGTIAESRRADGPEQTPRIGLVAPQRHAA